MCLQCCRLLDQLPGPLFACACGFQLCSEQCSRGRDGNGADVDKVHADNVDVDNDDVDVDVDNDEIGVND